MTFNRATFCRPLTDQPYPEEGVMKLLAIELSRVTSLYRMTRTTGQTYLPHIAAEIVGRYRFGSAPHSFADFSGDKAEFKHGLFSGSAIETLDIYNDGIIISSRSDSDFIDEFIHDFNSWLKDDYNVSIVETHTVGKIYESVLLVETDRDVLQPLNAYTEILSTIEEALRSTSKLKVKYENFGLSLSTDHTKNPALKPVPFRLERKEGIEFSRHQYHTIAPLRTKQHLEVLEQLEQLA